MAQSTLVPITETTTQKRSGATTALKTEQTSSQNTYRSPVDFQISLSGNVGEIRSNHFHTGIDIRGGGNIGAPVYAVMDGYVSRIGVSPFGYGYALYIAHPNGTTSVYGHLGGFAPKIASWVREQQYAKKSFAVNLYPDKTLLPVKRGERIASLGNSGSSGGPHLHFEIRNSGTQNPKNILSQGVYKIADNVAPTISRIFLFEADTIAGHIIFSQSSSVAMTKDKQSGRMVLRDSVLYASRPFYLAYEVTDGKDGSSFTMGIYEIEQKVDGQVNFGYRLDELSFATTRYANALSQYSLATKTRSDVIRTYVSPGNELELYRNVRNSGLLAPPAKQGARTRIETRFTDDNSNSQTVRLVVEKRSKPSVQKILTSKEQLVDCKSNFTYQDGELNVSIPLGALYDSHIVPIYKSEETYIIGSSDIPLQSNMIIRIATSIDPDLRDKALLLNSRGASVGGEWKNGVLECKVRTMGLFRIGYDTIAPKITPFAIGKGGVLKFKVTDNLSGIYSYELNVDSQWALLEYDPKNALMFYRFKRSANPKPHRIELVVRDGKGNISRHKSTEQW